MVWLLVIFMVGSRVRVGVLVIGFLISCVVVGCWVCLIFWGEIVWLIVDCFWLL